MKIDKKEKLIEWTREEKNKLKILIPCIAIVLIGVTIFGNETNWGKNDSSIIVSIIFSLVFLCIWYIWIIFESLFKTKEDTLRKNKISLVIFSDDGLWELILACFIAPIVYIGIFEKSEIMIKIIITIIAVIFILVIANVISKQFRKKLK